jgi:hypothetical protein
MKLDNSHSGQEELETVAVKHFKYFYVDTGHNSIIEQVRTVQYYPCLFTENDVQELEKPCTVKELFSVLKSFAKDKILGPDGWTVEFFLHFFYLIRDDILEVVEESRSSGSMVRSLNTTFLVLIPKVDKPSNFGDFRPITFMQSGIQNYRKDPSKQTETVPFKDFISGAAWFLKR